MDGRWVHPEVPFIVIQSLSHVTPFALNAEQMHPLEQLVCVVRHTRLSPAGYTLCNSSQTGKAECQIERPVINSIEPYYVHNIPLRTPFHPEYSETSRSTPCKLGILPIPPSKRKVIH